MALPSPIASPHRSHRPDLPSTGVPRCPLKEACLAPRRPSNEALSPRTPAFSRSQIYFRMSFKYREGRARSREGHGTFSREMMPELLWLFITPGKCGPCYFLIRLVLGQRGRGQPQPRGGGAWEHLTAPPPVPAHRRHPLALQDVRTPEGGGYTGQGWGDPQRALPSPYRKYTHSGAPPRGGPDRRPEWATEDRNRS